MRSAIGACGYPRCHSVFFSNPTAPHRDSPNQFSKRLSRIGKPCFDFKSPRPTSGQPFLFFVVLFPCRDKLFQFLIRGQRFENSCNIVSLRPINAQKFNIFVYIRQFSEEFVYLCTVFRKRHCSSFQNELAPQTESEQN